MAETNFHRVAVHDLSKHLDQRLTVILKDYMDRCAELGIDYDLATTLAMAVMAHHTACAAHGVNATENEFLAMCRWNFHKVAEQNRRDTMDRRYAS